MGEPATDEHERWKKFWDRQAEEEEDIHKAVRGERVFSDQVQAFHDGRLLELLSPKSTDHILDAGCGLGDHILLLADKVARITAIDYSASMVERCKARIDNAEVRNADVKEADVTNLPFPDDYFDGVISIAVLPWLPDEEVMKAFSEIKRVAKNGSPVIFHFKNTFSPCGLVVTSGRTLRALVKGRPLLQSHYRPYWWYTKRSRKFGRLVGRYSYGTWTPLMPRGLMGFIAALETRMARITPILRPFGKEYFLAIRVNK